MTQSIAENKLDAVSRRIAGEMGLCFPREKWRNLERAFVAAARDLGFPDAQACVDWYLSATLSRELVETVAGYLTTGETYFFRETPSLEILATRIVPELTGRRQGSERRLRIWSAGCSTGEEPYSIAITLQRLGTALAGWDLSILATDINPRALEKAEHGVYTEWSFRNPPRWLKQNYFSNAGNGLYEILPRTRQMVRFNPLNLVEDSYPSLLNGTNAMDVIFCRNVLMYFTPEQARRVIDRLHRCLADGGVLFVSPCETSQLLSSRFTPVNFPDAIMYRKQESAPDGPAEGGAPAPEEQPPPTGWTDSVAQDVQPPTAAAPRPSLYDEALCSYERGAYAEAGRLLEELLSLTQNESRALALLCRIRANEGQLDEALRLSGEAIAADKLNAGLHFLRGGILQEQGAADQAATSLKRALYLDQELVLAHFSLGNLALRQGKTAESCRYFNNAISLLKRYRPDETVPESGGIPAARLMAIIEATAARVNTLSR
jgi:chemotaxis protein methyltransferase CheR